MQYGREEQLVLMVVEWLQVTFNQTFQSECAEHTEIDVPSKNFLQAGVSSLVLRYVANCLEIHTH